MKVIRPRHRGLLARFLCRGIRWSKSHTQDTVPLSGKFHSIFNSTCELILESTLVSTLEGLDLLGFGGLHCQLHADRTTSDYSLVVSLTFREFRSAGQLAKGSVILILRVF